jgi:hypothetical protein
MNILKKFGLSLTLMGLAFISSGCNIMSLPYFLLMSDPKHEAELQSLAPKDKKTEKKVIILTYGKLDLRPELINSDREIAYTVEKNLKALTSANGDKVSIIPSRKVEEYKSSHSDWQDRDPAEIGKHFKADYVVYLEINSLGIYELGSGGTLYRGRADINISLIDIKNPDESQPSRNFTCQFPRESRMQVTASDQSPMEFRQTFLDYVGKRIAWKFAARPTRDDFYAD